MRLDHIAYRVKDRHKTAKFLEDTLGYKIVNEFTITFQDKTTADCIALTPPEDRSKNIEDWNININTGPDNLSTKTMDLTFTHHLKFLLVMEPKGSIVGDWVESRGGVGGVHHLAYQVDDVEKVMSEWKDKGYVEFLTEEPLFCKETKLTQVFSKPSELNRCDIRTY